MPLFASGKRSPNTTRRRVKLAKALAASLLAGVAAVWLTIAFTSAFTSAAPADGENAETVAAKSKAPAEIEGGKPSKERDDLFQDWPKPQLVLMFSGRQNGYIEPCGCTGLANQKGGLARKRTFYKSLLERGWPAAAFDVGNQVRRFGRQQEIKFQTTADALAKIDYQGVTFGPDDLKLPSADLFTFIAGEDAATSIFVCANVALLDRALTPRYRVVEAGGKKIGVTGVVGDGFLPGLHNADLIKEPAAQGLLAAWKELEKERCDLYVLLAHATLAETEALVKSFPKFGVVATAGGSEEPSFEAETVRGTKTLLVQVGGKGMYVGVVGLFADRKTPLRYERVPLDDRFNDDPEMLDLMASYQQQLEVAGLEGLGIKPIAHPSGRKFVGSSTCSECHTKAAAVWSETPHAHATDSLVHPAERAEIPRHFDPECLSCHVTGWNAEKFFPYETGYVDLEASKLLHGNGCENCHGPGAEHVAAEMGEGDQRPATIARLRKAMVLPLAKAESKCLECHDLDNSPDFHKPGAFQEYWKKVEHKGKD